MIVFSEYFLNKFYSKKYNDNVINHLIIKCRNTIGYIA